MSTQRVSLSIFEGDNATHVADIEAGEWRACDYTEILSAPGKWSVTLGNLVDGATNPALEHLTIGRIVRFLASPAGVDMPVEVGAGLIEDREVVVVAPTSHAGETTVVSGRGLLAIFDKIRVRPDRGTLSQPWSQTRYFNFSADRLRDDDPDGPQGVWPLAYGQLPNYDTDNYFGRPEGFTDTAGPDGDGPEWLWDQDTRTALADAGTCYFRQRFTTAEQVDMLFEFAADDEGELWVDNVPVCRTEGVYLGNCVKGGVRVSEGDHMISVKATNLNALRAGVVYAGWTVSDGLPDTLLVRSDSSVARCLPYPAVAPGFTPTEVVRLVIDEVQDLPEPRLADVTFSFLSASDTDDAEVDEVTDITCRAPGDSILTFLQMLAEHYLDFSVTPDSLELNAWIRGTRGDDLSASVAFAKGTCRRVTWDNAGSERATFALFYGSKFGGGGVAHADAATLGYEEVALDFGDAEEDTALEFATAYLNLVSQGRKGVTIELVPGVGPVPYEDFGIGDTISIPGEDGTAEDHRVTAISFRVRSDSICRWTIDLDQPRALLEERLDMIMRRQLPASAGGRTFLPTTTTPQFVSNEKGSEDVHTWQWDGPLDEIQVYKNGSPITGATLTVTSGNTEKSTITTSARKFVKEADKFTITAGGGDASPEWVPPKGRWLQEVRVTADAVSDSYTITLSVT